MRYNEVYRDIIYYELIAYNRLYERKVRHIFSQYALYCNAIYSGPKKLFRHQEIENLPRVQGTKKPRVQETTKKQPRKQEAIQRPQETKKPLSNKETIREPKNYEETKIPKKKPQRKQ